MRHNEYFNNRFERIAKRIAVQYSKDRQAAGYTLMHPLSFTKKSQDENEIKDNNCIVLKCTEATKWEDDRGGSAGGFLDYFDVHKGKGEIIYPNHLKDKSAEIENLINQIVSEKRLEQGLGQLDASIVIKNGKFEYMVEDDDLSVLEKMFDNIFELSDGTKIYITFKRCRERSR